MLRSISTWLVPVALTIIGVGANSQIANALTKYSFETTYNGQTTLTPIAQNVLRINSVGENIDAPYGLSKLTNISYGEFNPSTGTITIDPDPAKFGLKNLEFGSFTLFGQGKDRLFGTTSGIAILDFTNAVGTVINTISITGGSGRFRGATGTLLLSENLTLNNPDITAPVTVMPKISGTFQTVPEANQTMGLVCISMIAFFSLNRRRAFKGYS